MTRNRSALVVGIAVTLVLASPARADHPEGAPVYSDEVGPYLVEARVALTEASERRFIQYSVSVEDAETSERVQDARVVATVTTPEGERGPLELGGLGDAWTIAIPLDEDEPVRWTVDVELESSLGEASFRHPLRLDPRAEEEEEEAAAASEGTDGDGARTLPIVGGITAAVILAVVLLVRQGRHRQAADG